MTEREKVKEAKRWIDRLAQGIHPVTGEILPDSDAVNNVRVSRCLFYVSSLLQRQLDRDFSEKGTDFSLSDSAQMTFSAQPIPASDLARRLNVARQLPGGRKVSYRLLTEWLLAKGFLKEVIRPNGHKSRRPTPTGEQLGIVVEYRSNNERSYPVVLYMESAQRFVAEHLDEILSYAVDKP